MLARRIFLGLSVLVWTAFACADPAERETPKDAGIVIDGGVVARDGGVVERDGGVVERDGGVVERDGGTPAVGLNLKSSNLAPATGRASSTQYNLNGQLRATSADIATTGNHTLRGGVVAGGAQTSTTTN